MLNFLSIQIDLNPIHLDYDILNIVLIIIAAIRYDNPSAGNICNRTLNVLKLLIHFGFMIIIIDVNKTNRFIIPNNRFSLYDLDILPIDRIYDYLRKIENNNNNNKNNIIINIFSSPPNQ
ncbi:hypothetical protein DERP_010211 [Dermatophagoides pteronyssinus]|uniref:Uncharacterized protein n=1 Tax=Dermatophagoides pteronyssinus TaxID=6956 RepID=A0ABQ8J718_DERPT|nr:hypothetical protein DERP_010211 [Dermatophagoides pteronyssinus]